MVKSITTSGIFKPLSSKAETRSQVTDNTARAIVEAETSARDKKTAKLRAARLAKEAVESEAPPPVPAKPARKTAGSKARAAKA